MTALEKLDDAALASVAKMAKKGVTPDRVIDAIRAEINRRLGLTAPPTEETDHG
jgi:hypothetical protein